MGEGRAAKAGCVRAFGGDFRRTPPTPCPRRETLSDRRLAIARGLSVALAWTRADAEARQRFPLPLMSTLFRKFSLTIC